MKNLLILVLAVWATQISAQNDAFNFGENLTFSASYNMSGVLTDVAQVKMETSKLNTNSGELMRLKITATSYSSFDSYFKIRDLYESYVNPKTIKPTYTIVKLTKVDITNM
jgi:type II secretory pathway component PulL